MTKIKVQLAVTVPDPVFSPVPVAVAVADTVSSPVSRNQNKKSEARS